MDNKEAVEAAVDLLERASTWVTGARSRQLLAGAAALRGDKAPEPTAQEVRDAERAERRVQEAEAAAEAARQAEEAAKAAAG